MDTSLLYRFSHMWPYILVLAILLLVAVAIYVWRSRGENQKPKDNSEEPGREPRNDGTTLDITMPLQLRRSFMSALQILKSHVSGRNYRYQIPWFLILGEAGSGKTTLLKNTHLNLPLGSPPEVVSGLQRDCNWWFFDNGIVLDINGNYVLHSDGRGSDERGWRALLKLLRKYRPERPIDGIILTIPCNDLIDARSADAEQVARLREKAESLYRKLWDTQKNLAIRFPIYILVTKCDRIRGFQSFCQALPDQFHDDVFGWSNPYSLDAAYTTDWVDEAFRSLHDHLYELQMEIAAGGIHVEQSDDLFLFPSEFQGMVAPLRIYLDCFFKQSVYHESFYARGIYFCGDDGQMTPLQDDPISQPEHLSASVQVHPPDSPPEPLAGMAEATESAMVLDIEPVEAHPKTPLFLKHLFERKIFPESGLAQPVSRTLLARSRAMRITQYLIVAVLVFGCLGLWVGHDHLEHQKQMLSLVLEETIRDLGQMGDLEKVSPAFFETKAKRLLERMTAVERSTLRSLFIPPSWFAQIHDDIIDGMKRPFDRIIMASIFIELNHRAKALCTLQRDASGGVDEFRELQQYVNALDELDRHVALYNELRIAGNADFGALTQLVQYLFGIELADSFGGYYEEALARASGQEFQVDSYVTDASAKCMTLIRSYYRRLFERNTLMSYSHDLFSLLELMRQQERDVSVQDVDMFHHLLDIIMQMEDALGAPEFSWLANETFDLGGPFGKVLVTIETSNFLKPNLRSEIVNLGTAKFRALKATFADYKTDDVLKLKDALREFLSQDFAAMQPTLEFRTTIPPGMQLVWDKEKLDEAIQLSERYTEFLGSGLQEFSADWRGILGDIAQHRLRANMANSMAEAQALKPVPEGFTPLSLEGDVREEAQAFKMAAPALEQLLSIFDALGDVEFHDKLLRLLVRQATDQLAQVDLLLGSEGLYQVESFMSWDGVQTLSTSVFHARDVAELKRYVDFQRERIQFLATEYAEPAVTFIESHATSQVKVQNIPSLSKWQTIIAELRDHANQKPGNSVAELEGFFLTEMDGIQASNFLEKITPQQLAERSSDFFRQRRNALRRAVYERCMTVAQASTVRGYGDVMTFFNREIAGRFPFRDLTPGGTDTELSPDVLRRFFHRFDRYIGPATYQLIQDDASSGRIPVRTLEFVDSMLQTRQFFSTFLDGEVSGLPVYDLVFAFRVNHEYELGGDKILEWWVEVGSQTVRNSDEELQARWRLGDPIRVVIRWAPDTVQTPLGEDAPVPLTGRRILFDYINQWSLLWFLRQHASSAADFESLSDPSPHTLKFVIRGETGTDGQPTSSGVTAFMRVTVMSPDRKGELVMPSFPRHAPTFERTTGSP